LWSALERTGDRPSLAPDRQRHAALVLDDLDHTGVTSDPARDLRGDE
jgi:hypothetical protein